MALKPVHGVSAGGLGASDVSDDPYDLGTYDEPSDLDDLEAPDVPHASFEYLHHLTRLSVQISQVLV